MRQARVHRHSILQYCALALCAMVIAGCGFSPIFATKQATQDLQGEVAIAPAKNRLALSFRNALENLLGDPKPQPRWQLKYRISQATTDFLIADITEVTRRQVRVTVHYTLLPHDGGETAAESMVVVESSYNVTGSSFAIRQTAETAREAAAEAAARQVWLGLAAAAGNAADTPQVAQ